MDNIKPNQVKWISLENEDATATLKQHGYFPTEDGGNKALCSQTFASNDGETPSSWDSLMWETRHSQACKKCLKKFLSLTPNT